MLHCRLLLFTLLCAAAASLPTANAGYRKNDFNFEEVFNTGAYNMGIIQDQEGFLWFSTTGGLIRFDGYDKLVFTDGPGGLTSNFVPSVFEDSEGLLWIVTLSGLDLYNKKNGTIVNFQPDSSTPGTIGSNAFNWAPRLITEDGDGGIWIGSRNGVYRYDKIKQAFFPLQNPAAVSLNGSGFNDIWTVLADSEGKIWIGSSAGLDVYDRATDSFTHFRHDSTTIGSLGKGTVYAVHEDSDGDIWVGTSMGGLARFERETGTFFTYTHDLTDPTSLAHNEVFSITEDSSGNLWLGRSYSVGVGLERFDRTTEKFSLYAHNSQLPGTLSGNIILTVFEDRSGTLWVPDNTGPVSKHDPFSHRFELFQSQRENLETHGLSGLTSVYEDSRGDIWLGGQKGLSRLNPDTGQLTSFTIDPYNPLKLWNNYTFSVIEDSDGNFWVASDDGYLNLFDRDQGTVMERYLNPHVQSTARQIIEDRNTPHLFWFGVEGHGLFSFNRKTTLFTQYASTPDNPEGLGNDYIYSIVQDHDNIIWVQTQGGLHRFDPETKKFTRFTHRSDDPQSISSNVVNDIFIDSKKRFWVSTDRGLNTFDPDSGKFTSFGLDHGFSTLIIRAIVEDDTGNLWLGSNSGLFVFDPVAEKVIRKYTISDGLQDDSFSLYGGSATKTSSGRLWFVGLNGANSFKPEEIRHNTIPPLVYLLNISQGGEELVSRLKIDSTEEIDLDWQHNYFEFEYVGLNFSQPLKNQYQYKLEGWDTDWYFAGNKRFGRYSGLSGGDYVLKVKASNNDAVWNDTPAAITIRVASPFWKTFWFYPLIISSFLAVFSLFYLIRVRRLENFNRELENAYFNVHTAEKKFRSIFENATEGIFQMTLEGRLINANPAAAAIMGFTSREEMVEKILAVREWALLSDKKLFRLLRRLQKQGSVIGHEIQVRKNDNTIIWLVINIRLIEDESGHGSYIDGIMDDITIRKSAEKQLQLYHEHLEQLVDERTREYQEINANLEREIKERERVEEDLLRSKKLESIGVLAGGIAHDFNNLLTVIMGNVSLAQLKTSEKQIAELDNALQALHRAKDLTRKFTTFSSGGDPIKTANDMEEVTRSAVELALSGSNVQAVFTVAPNLPQANIDRGYISQAMYNIIENSKQVMKNGGILKVGITTLFRNSNSPTEGIPVAEGTYVVIDFEDSGSGIPTEHLPKIFDPYFTTADMGAKKGKGLGLTIAHSIIKKHGGHIFVDSTVGEGTRFQVLLPAIADHQATADDGLQDPVKAGKILLMDDEEMLRDMAKLMLSSMGYEVAVAADGNTAITMHRDAYADGRPFDAAILDLTIPGSIGGQEVVKVLLQIDPELKAIVSSGYADDPVVAHHRQYGFIATLAKPYDMSALQHLLDRIFKDHKKQRVSP